MAYIDNYTMMNSQEAHYMKHFLRFKCKENPERIVQLWSRVALIIDSDIPDVKYLLEVTEKGIEYHEFLQRMMEFKKDQERVIAWMRCLQPIGDGQKSEMYRMAQFLQGKNWKKIFANEEQDHESTLHAV
jgi:hypothetical protein